MSVIRGMATGVVCLGALLGSTVMAFERPVHRLVLPDGRIALQDLLLDTPDDWTLAQDAIVGGTLILGFSSDENAGDEVTYYVSNRTDLDPQGIFVNDSRVRTPLASQKHGRLAWQRIETSKTTTFGDRSRTTYVSAFFSIHGNRTYYGYASSESAERARHAADTFLDATGPLDRWSMTIQSLSGGDYTGKKYYFGFSDVLSGSMENEVTYDVAHTHDIFTKKVGGSYIGTVQHGGEVGHKSITRHWDELKKEVTASDMYVQYSSGHGEPSGLGIGVSFDEIRDFALSLKAKEIVIFTMSCYSGNLVDAFNRRKGDWKDWQSEGRTLLVMSSSKSDETSSTGPGTDPDEVGGPDGSAGSAFGFSLWKALIGYADGYVDGVKDGFISLGEIMEFTRMKTLAVGGHTPTVTGSYNPSLIMNQVPNREFLTSLKGGTEGMSDAEVMRRVKALDTLYRVQ